MNSSGSLGNLTEDLHPGDDYVKDTDVSGSVISGVASDTSRRKSNRFSKMFSSVSGSSFQESSLKARSTSMVSGGYVLQ